MIDWLSDEGIRFRAAYDKVFQAHGLDLMDRHIWEDEAEIEYQRICREAEQRKAIDSTIVSKPRNAIEASCIVHNPTSS